MGITALVTRASNRPGSWLLLAACLLTFAWNPIQSALATGVALEAAQGGLLITSSATDHHPDPDDISTGWLALQIVVDNPLDEDVADVTVDLPLPSRFAVVSAPG